MKTREMPHGVVGCMFAWALLKGDYDVAHGMLSPDLKDQYSVVQLQGSFEEMMSLTDTDALPDVEVMDNGELGNSSLDNEGWAYVAIRSEAVTVTVRRFGPEYLITELIWGRP
jgi:hypothetical protein